MLTFVLKPLPLRLSFFTYSNDIQCLKNLKKQHLSETMYATLPKSWKEQNLITQTEVMEDLEELAKRQKLTQEKTPAELAQISSLADMPIPTALENFLKSDHGNGIENSTPKKPLTER